MKLLRIFAICTTAAIFFCTSQDEAISQTVNLDKIWTTYRAALVKIEVSGTNALGKSVTITQGTGIIVRSNGKILTAMHVVEPAAGEAGWKRDPDGTLVREVSVTRLDQSGFTQSLGHAFVTEIPQYDIAVLDVNAFGLADIELNAVPLPTFAAVAVLLWDPNTSIGRPVQAQLTTTDRAKYGDRLTIEMYAVPGNSGAPVFSADGKLAGIVTNTIDERKALAVPVYLFDRWVPPPIAASDRNATQPAHFTVDLTEFHGGSKSYPIQGNMTVQTFLNDLYVEINRTDKVDAYQYGKQWVLQDARGARFMEMGGGTDNRPLTQLAINSGETLKARKLLPLP